MVFRVCVGGSASNESISWAPPGGPVDVEDSASHASNSAPPLMYSHSNPSDLGVSSGTLTFTATETAQARPASVDTASYQVAGGATL